MLGLVFGWNRRRRDSLGFGVELDDVTKMTIRSEIFLDGKHKRVCNG